MAIDEQDVGPATGPEAGERSPAEHRHRRLAVGSVLVVLALCGVLRSITADAHLPWQHHWDEATNVTVGQRMSDDLSIDPGFYDYPALVFVTQAAVLVPATLIGGYDPDDDGPVLDTQVLGTSRVEHPALLRAMRWTTGVLPQLVTTAVAAAIAWVVTRRWYAAAGAAVLVTLSAVDLRYGTFVTPDALSGMAATLAVLGAVMITRAPTTRRYLWTGAAIGLAASAKYNAAAVVIALVVAHVLAHRRPLAERRPLLIAAAAAAAVFAVVNLGGTVHPLDFLGEIGSEGAHYRNGHFGSEGNSPAFNATWLWWSFGLALPLAACSLLSRASDVRRAAIVLLSFAVGYYVFLSAFPVRFARNLLPISGTIAAAAAIGLVVCMQRLVEAGSRRTAGWAATGVLVVAVLALPVTGAAGALRSVDEDPWGEVNTWLAENAPAGSTVAIEAFSPYIDEARFNVLVGGSPLIGTTGGGLRWFEDRGVDYYVASDEMFQPFLDHPEEDPGAALIYLRLLSDECRVHEAEGAGHRLVVAKAPCDP